MTSFLGESHLDVNILLLRQRNNKVNTYLLIAIGADFGIKVLLQRIRVPPDLGMDLYLNTVVVLCYGLPNYKRRLP
jgi:hypothetical protein